MSVTPAKSSLPSRSESTPLMNVESAPSRSAPSEPAGMISSHFVFHAERPTRRVQSSESSFGSLPASS